MKVSLRKPISCGPMPLPTSAMMNSRIAIADAREDCGTTPCPMVYCAPR
jgi:hypothetical protein